MSDILLTLDEVQELATECLQANGCDLENATAVANTLRAAERDNCSSHGIFRLPGYIASLRSGKWQSIAAYSAALIECYSSRWLWWLCSSSVAKGQTGFARGNQRKWNCSARIDQRAPFRSALG